MPRTPSAKPFSQTMELVQAVKTGKPGTCKRSANVEPTAETDPGRAHFDADFFARAFARTKKKTV
jgi:hypothetical protein